MKLIVHQMLRDVRMLGWSLVVWLACGLYLLLTKGAFFNAEQAPQMIVYLICVVLVSALTCTLAAKLVQVDGPMDSCAFWRTRPISPGRLLAAKGLLVTLLFVVTPAVVTVAIERRAGMQLENLPTLLLAWAAIAAFSLAVGACTKDSSRFVLVAILCVVASSALRGAFLISSVKGLHFQFRTGVVSGQWTAVFCVLIGVAVLLSQYLWRRPAVSYALLAVGVAGSAVLASLGR